MWNCYFRNGACNDDNETDLICNCEQMLSEDEDGWEKIVFNSHVEPTTNFEACSEFDDNNRVNCCYSQILPDQYKRTCELYPNSEEQFKFKSEQYQNHRANTCLANPTYICKTKGRNNFSRSNLPNLVDQYQTETGLFNNQYYIKQDKLEHTKILGSRQKLRNSQEKFKPLQNKLDPTYCTICLPSELQDRFSPNEICPPLNSSYIYPRLYPFCCQYQYHDNAPFFACFNYGYPNYFAINSMECPPQLNKPLDNYCEAVVPAARSCSYVNPCGFSTSPFDAATLKFRDIRGGDDQQYKKASKNIRSKGKTTTKKKADKIKIPKRKKDFDPKTKPKSDQKSKTKADRKSTMKSAVKLDKDSCSSTVPFRKSGKKEKKQDKVGKTDIGDIKKNGMKEEEVYLKFHENCYQHPISPCCCERTCPLQYCPLPQNGNFCNTCTPLNYEAFATPCCYPSIFSQYERSTLLNHPYTYDFCCNPCVPLCCKPCVSPCCETCTSPCCNTDVPSPYRNCAASYCTLRMPLSCEASALSFCNPSPHSYCYVPLNCGASRNFSTSCRALICPFHKLCCTSCGRFHGWMDSSHCYPSENIINDCCKCKSPNCLGSDTMEKNH